MEIEMECLHELFEAQTDSTPEAPALICGELNLSYSELDKRANQVARFLATRGAGPGKFIGIYFERSAQPIVTILACLKVGAAYVPIDPSYPQDRIRTILKESDAVLLLTDTYLIAKAQAIRDTFDRPILALDSCEDEISKQSSERLSRAETGVSSKDLCYVIYTSGTTGRPKGIMTEHRNVCKFVAAFNEVCGTNPQDRVFQGFSLSFDGSVEEIWMAFSNGSTLIVPDRKTPRFGNELGKFFTQNRITYFSTVPTLLSTITEGAPSLKTLVVSGEVCPPELVSRWATPSLRMLNVYGPTEATVNTTAAECLPDQPVTIGRALRGYQIHILDQNGLPVKPGEKGELYVGGETLARGYLKQPELSAERFFSVSGSRLYKTGDLVRINASGDLEFFGRIDSQIKIRGYRVELAEIESVLLEHAEIQSASVKLFEREGLQELAAYVVLESGNSSLDREAVLSLLESRMPSYMLPGYLDILNDLPRLTSGKVDRGQLPEPREPLVRTATRMVRPETDLEKIISAVWARIFRVSDVSVEDDFFLDLGGHSLVAAQMVTLLRKETDFHVTVRDAYTFSTIRSLAVYLESQREEPAQAHELPVTRATVPVITSILQMLSIYLLYGVRLFPIVLLYIASRNWLLGSLSLHRLIAVWLAVTFLTRPVMTVLSVVAKWAIVGRYKEGQYRLWGFYHFRIWLAGRFQALSSAGSLAGTPLLPLYFRAMGAKVGDHCILDSSMASSFDLLSIGDDTSIGADSQYLGYRVENGLLHIGRVEIGSRCFVGIHSALALNVRMEDDTRLEDQSLLSDHEVIPAGEGRHGSPARPSEVVVPPAYRATWRRSVLGAAQLGLNCLMPVIFLLPAVPFLFLWLWAFNSHGILGGTLALIVSVPLGFIAACLFTAAIKKLALRSARPGIYPIESTLYLRKWLSDGIMRSSREFLLPLYTTIYLPPWLRLLGAKIGARAELSTVWNFAPELIDVGEESFFADGSIIGGKRIFGGSFEIAINKIGKRSFVGNSAVLPVGSSLGNGCLLGVQSIPPRGPGAQCTADGTDWLGSPAFALPHRLKVGGFDDSVTFHPTRKLYLQRAVIDALRILIPGYIGLTSGVAGIMALDFVLRKYGTAAMFYASPAVALILAVYAALLVIALKWSVMGRFKPVIVPLWSMYVWLNEMVNGAYESVMTPALSPFLGTPFLAPFLRLIGCKIGKHAYIESALFSEFDLVEIGDFAALNAGSVIQSHLFEDRVMKSSTLKIGEGCSVGNMAVMLYDSEMQNGAVLGPLSLLMKGEVLAPSTRWYGIPTIRTNTKAPSPDVQPLRTDLSQSLEPVLAMEGVS